MHKFKFIVLPCDGIGPEIVDASVRVLKAAAARYKVDLQLDYKTVGFDSLNRFGTTLREDVLQMSKDYDGIILGTQSHADYPKPEEGGRNVSSSYRVGLDLYANIRPARTRSYVDTNMPEGRAMDLVIMRESTEGFYADRNMTRGCGEMMPSPDMALAVRKITRHCSERIARRSFELAMTRRKKLTAIHKLNCFLMTDGLFMDAVRNVAKDFPDVEFNDLLVDASTAHLVRTPEVFDVIVTTNFFGDILSDLTSELSGGLGMAGSINAGDDMCCAQAQHGSAPTIAGKDIANPVSMILSVAMMLSWLGDRRKSEVLSEMGAAMTRSVDKVLENPLTRTRDIGGSMGCRDFAACVEEVVARA